VPGNTVPMAMTSEHLAMVPKDWYHTLNAIIFLASHSGFGERQAGALCVQRTVAVQSRRAVSCFFMGGVSVWVGVVIKEVEGQIEESLCHTATTPVDRNAPPGQGCLFFRRHS